MKRDLYKAFFSKFLFDNTFIFFDGSYYYEDDYKGQPFWIKFFCKLKRFYWLETIRLKLIPFNMWLKKEYEFFIWRRNKFFNVTIPVIPKSLLFTIKYVWRQNQFDNWFMREAHIDFIFFNVFLNILLYIRLRTFSIKNLLKFKKNKFFKILINKTIYSQVLLKNLMK